MTNCVKCKVLLGLGWRMDPTGRSCCGYLCAACCQVCHNFTADDAWDYLHRFGDGWLEIEDVLPAHDLRYPRDSACADRFAKWLDNPVAPLGEWATDRTKLVIGVALYHYRKSKNDSNQN